MGDALARLVLASTASLAVLTGAGRAARAEESCARLVAPPDLAPAWAQVVLDLTRALAELPSTECRPLTLVLEPADGAVRLIAQAPDGRRAVRTVAQPSLLVPVALGLVISGSADTAGADSAPASAAASTGPSPPSGAAGPVAPSVVHPAALDVPSPHAVAIWLGLGIGARIGVPSTVSMAAIEARADLRVDRLLLFVSFRNVPVGFVAGQGFDGDAYHESSIAFGVGRGISIGPDVVDLSIAPSLVTMRLSKDAPVHARDDDVELRVGASARLNVPLSANWRLTLSIDTDVIPDFLRSELRIDPLPAFPSWTSGFCLGLSGEVL
jgi:hypothetical protein